MYSSTSSTHIATSAASPFAAQFDAPLPSDLREEAHTMTTEAFETTYAPTSGPVRLGQWQCTDAKRGGTRIGTQAHHYEATIAVGERIGTSTATATGPVAALTEMLYERGIAVEMLRFHQLQADGGVATFIRGTDGSHDAWAMGLSDDPIQSALRALVACANRLQP
jgi:hypothetical protein